MKNGCILLGGVVLATGILGCGAESGSDVADEPVGTNVAAVVEPSSIAQVLNGFMFKSPCVTTTGVNVCTTKPAAAACTATGDPVYTGVLPTDKTVTLGGSAAKTYTVTLRVQGVVEARDYTGGTDANGVLSHPAANGAYTGGLPTSLNLYNVYSIRTTSPARTYYLNSLVPPHAVTRAVFGVDYTMTIQAKGQSTIRLAASDANCVQIKNCGPIDNGQCSSPIVKVPTQAARTANPDVNFSNPYNGQWLTLTVTRVTS